jgi:hypothetical protein
MASLRAVSAGDRRVRSAGFPKANIMDISPVRMVCARRTAPFGRTSLGFTARVGDGGQDRG